MMRDKEIITLDEAQVAAERFLEDRLKAIKRLSIGKVKLTSIEGLWLTTSREWLLLEVVCSPKYRASL